MHTIQQNTLETKMALKFTNTRNEPLMSNELTTFIYELNWVCEDGTPCVFKKDGYVEYRGERYPYEVEDRGWYRLEGKTIWVKTVPNGKYRSTRIVEWVGVYVTFQQPEYNETNRYYPIVQNGKYYLIYNDINYNGHVRNVVFAEGFHPVAVPPTAVPPTAHPSSEALCSICFEEPANYAAVPCGHKCGCKECFQTVMNKDMRCPICRTDIDCVIRVYDMATQSHSVVTTKPDETAVLNLNNPDAFPPLPSPQYIVNINSRYNVLENGRNYNYTCGEFLNKFNKDSKNIVTWKLSNGDEQHGRIFNVYNQLYMSMIDVFPQFKTKFPKMDAPLVSLMIAVESFKEEHKNSERAKHAQKPQPHHQTKTVQQDHNKTPKVSTLNPNARHWTPGINIKST